MSTLFHRITGLVRPHLVPSFLIIGAQKAGTSALFKMLAQHPQVIAPNVKEQHFFDIEATYRKGIRHYRQRFPLVPLRGPRPVTFEATPAYLYVDRCAKRIRTHLPDAPLVVVLRDPVKRAFSAWNMFRSFGQQSSQAHLRDIRSFTHAVNDEMNGKLVRPEHRYLARGHYAEQLQRYFDLFDRERITIVKYPDLKNDPASVLDRVCAAVGLAPHHFNETTLQVKDNVRAYPEPMDPEVAEKLYAYFAPQMQELQRMLGPGWDLGEHTNTGS